MNYSFSKNEYENPIPYLAGTGKGSLALLVCFVPYLICVKFSFHWSRVKYLL